ncbi:winged helix-turn-helix domain-containing protein [Brevibacterium sp. 'Marine']|uniref:ArsR/SmtB family transcription factor n=1 Tax=Brevibacterium sp. 'Marine' TaxID=2725563 RepID=UPI00145DF1DD|nr:winged helix-turn-helix domain-containing protein [Brevibacterium sp. 'Marine']
MESTPSADDRLSALERRVAELEAAAASIAPPRPAAGEAATALPGDAETFWALHGLVDHLGEAGGVTYTGYTTPPGGSGPVAWQMGLSSAGLAQIDFAEAAGSLAALGHPVRLQLLQAIYEGTSTVAELGKDERFGTSGQIYHHVHALAGAGWLESARRGHWRVPAQRVVPLLTLVLIGTH